MEKASLSAIGSIFTNGPNFYNTDGPANCVKFDKDIPRYMLEKFEKKIFIDFYLCSGVWIIFFKYQVH